MSIEDLENQFHSLYQQDGVGNGWQTKAEQHLAMPTDAVNVTTNHWVEIDR